MAMLKVIEVLAESKKSWEDAAQEAVTTAAKTMRGIKSINVKNFFKPPSIRARSSVIASMRRSHSRLRGEAAFLLFLGAEDEYHNPRDLD